MFTSSLSLILFVFFNQLHIAISVNTSFIENSNFKQLLPTFWLTLLPPLASNLPPGECKNHVNHLETAARAGEKWALQMLDATAKPQAGILSGNIMHIGNYDECLEINRKIGSDQIKGKYCSAFFQPHRLYGQDFAIWLDNFMRETTRNAEQALLAVEGKISYGFCVPKACMAENLQNLSTFLEDEAKSPVHFVFHDKFCDSDDDVTFTPSVIAGIVVFSSFAALMIISTLYEMFFYRDDGSPNICIAFSVVTNGKKLFSPTVSKENLGCLDGLRVISMMWIVLAHGFQYGFFAPHINSVQLLSVWQNATENGFIAGSSISVDTFFTISGLLVVFLFMKSQTKGIKFSLPMFYLHRILRLTPSLVMVIIFTLTLLTYMGNGPLWPIVEDMLYKPCETNWWSTLIYLQNYIHTNEQCVGQAWYLAVDTQMYFLSPLIFFPLVKWPKQTIGAILVFVVLNCAYVFEITFKKHLGTTFFDSEPVHYMYLYAPTHVRGTVYLMGMVLGYFVYQTKIVKPLKLSKLKVLILWIFALLVLVLIVLGHSWMITPEYSPLKSSFFNSLTRVGWSFALSIVILLCVNNYGGFINSFLSCQLFSILIRLNYNIYLLHLALMMVFVGRGRTPTHFSNVVGFHNFWGDYIFSVAASIIWTLAFESPIITIEKLIFGGKKAAPTKIGSKLKNGKSLEGITTVEIPANGSSITITRSD